MSRTNAGQLFQGLTPKNKPEIESFDDNKLSNDYAILLKEIHKYKLKTVESWWLVGQRVHKLNEMWIRNQLPIDVYKRCKKNIKIFHKDYIGMSSTACYDVIAFYKNYSAKALKEIELQGGEVTRALSGHNYETAIRQKIREEKRSYQELAAEWKARKGKMPDPNAPYTDVMGIDTYNKIIQMPTTQEQLTLPTVEITPDNPKPTPIRKLKNLPYFNEIKSDLISLGEIKVDQKLEWLNLCDKLIKEIEQLKQIKLIEN